MESLSQGNNCFKETHVRFFKRVDRFRYCGRSGTYLSKQGRVRALVKNVDNLPHLRSICASRSRRDDNKILNLQRGVNRWFVSRRRINDDYLIISERGRNALELSRNGYRDFKVQWCTRFFGGFRPIHRSALTVKIYQCDLFTFSSKSAT